MALSGQHLSISEIVEHHRDCRSALRFYFGMPYSDPARFALLAPSEIDRNLADRLDELDLSQSLVVLAAIEAMFRVDFEKRVNERKRDPLSRAFRKISQARGKRVSFDEDILETWKASGMIASATVSEIRGAMNLRHWLAHGRYWSAKLGRRYDFASLIDLADALANSNKLLI